MAQERTAEKVFGGHLGAVTMGMFAPDGKTVVTTSIDQTARLWRIDSESELRRYTQHTGPVLCLAVSGNGTVLATGAQDNTVRIWDLPLGKPLRVFAGDQQQVNAIAISPLGDAIVSASADRGVGVFSLTETGKPFITRKKTGDAVELQSIAYRNDGAIYASGDIEGRIVLWSPFLDAPQGEWLSHDGAVSDMGFMSNNQQLISAGDDGAVRTWQSAPTLSRAFDMGDKPVIDWSVFGSRDRSVCLADDGLMFVLNLSNGEIEREFTKLDFTPRSITLAPNNSWICVADDSGRTHLLNIDGSPRAVIEAHRGAVRDVAVHPDSNRFATCGDDGYVRIWGQPIADANSHEPTHAFLIDPDARVPATSIVFTADQKELICGASDGKIHQWNLANGERVRTIYAHVGSDAQIIVEVAVTPNSQTLLSLGRDQTLRSFKLSDGSALKVMHHPTAVRSLSVSPDSSRVAVACDDGIVRLWDLDSGTLLQAIPTHAAAVVNVTFAADGQSIVSASSDHSLQVTKPSIIRAMQVHDSAIRSMAIYGGGSGVVTCDRQHVVMTNTSNGTEIRSYRVMNNDSATADANAKTDVTYREIEPSAVDVRSDNQRVAVGTESGEVYVWNANNGESPILSLQVDFAVTAITYSPDNRQLAVATGDNRVHVFGPSVPGTQPQIELVPHQEFKLDAVATDLAFAADSQSVYVSLSNGQVQQWYYAGIAQRRQMNHGGPVYGVAVSHDGTLAVSCSSDRTIRVWDTTTGQQKSQMNGHNSAVHAIAISSDETFAVSSGADGTIRLWDIVGGRQLKQLNKFDDTMYSVAIHPGGQWVATAGADREIHLLDMITGQELQTLKGHTDYIHCVAFNADGDRLLSYGYAGQLKLWDPSEGKLLHELQFGNVGNDAQFSPDGKQILLSNGDGTASIIQSP
ncbi:MAG: WD40 repeat domain-containing protein [Planctomycetales bacterium]|nr:WD40 repeat domain-containing protein [Planctomycetales bacterium]